MHHWFVIHDYSAYEIEPNLIGKEIRLKGKISGVSKGDKVLYYATGDMVVINSFDVISNGFEYESIHQKHPWDGKHWSYKIKKRIKRTSLPVPIHEIVKSVNLALFPDNEFLPIKFKGRTAIKISKKEYNSIEEFMKSYIPMNTLLFKGAPNEGNLGEPIDLGILNYAPTSEQGVVVLFANFMSKLPQNFVKMEFVRSGFPDACVIQKNGNLFSRRYIEFEFRASSFKQHIRNNRHKDIKCDFVVCWENDFFTCPIPVIELKSELIKLNQKTKKVG